MQFSSALLGLAAIAASTVTAQAGTTIQVLVGPDGKLEYVPNDIVVPVGTQVEFLFNPKNHTVTQSSFANPCHPLANGFFSGFVPTTVAPSSTTFTITVNDTTPIWFYCGQTTGNHCQTGMVGAINPPSTGNTLSAFIELAAKANTSTSPPVHPVGGILSTSNNTSSVSSSVVTTAAATQYAVTTYTSNSQTYTTTIGTTTVIETLILGPTAAANVGSSSSSTGSAPAQTSHNAASGLTAHMLGVAAAGLGALAFL